jgi:hypothetical protein
MWASRSRRSIPLRSARFPYVSPSGAVEFCGDEGRFTYLVDGGTVDSSAAEPAVSMLEEIIRWARHWNANQDDGAPCVQPVVVQLDNGYEDIVAREGGDRPSELVAPIQSVITPATANAETARQQLAALGTQLRRRAGCDDAPNLPTYLQVYPHSHPGTEAPLGWSLSEESRDDLQDQLRSAPNQCSLLALRYWLAGSAGSGQCVTGTVAGPDGMAASGQVVCLAEGADSSVRVQTNAYGVFVHAYDHESSPPSLTPRTDEEGCDDVTLVAGATYGEAGTFDLGYRLTVNQAVDPSWPRSRSRSSPSPCS